MVELYLHSRNAAMAQRLTNYALYHLPVLGYVKKLNITPKVLSHNENPSRLSASSIDLPCSLFIDRVRNRSTSDADTSNLFQRDTYRS
jgi:hypothetical protein